MGICWVDGDCYVRNSAVHGGMGHYSSNELRVIKKNIYIYISKVQGKFGGKFLEGGWNWSIFHHGNLSFASSTFFNPLRHVCLLFKRVLTHLDVFCLPFLTRFDVFWLYWPV